MALRISSMRKIAMEALVVDSSGDSSSDDTHHVVKRGPALPTATAPHPMTSPPLRSQNTPGGSSPGTHHLDSDGGGVERALAHFQKKASRRQLKATGRAQTSIVSQRPNEFHSPRTAKVEAALHALMPTPRRVEGHNPLKGTAVSASASPSQSRGQPQPLVATGSPRTKPTSDAATHVDPLATQPPRSRKAITPTLQRVQTHAAMLHAPPSTTTVPPMKRVASGCAQPPPPRVATAHSLRKLTTARIDTHPVTNGMDSVAKHAADSKKVGKKKTPPSNPAATVALSKQPGGSAPSQPQSLNTAALPHHANVVLRSYGTQHRPKHQSTTAKAQSAGATQLSSSFHDEAMMLSSPAPRDPVVPLGSTSSGPPLAAADQSRGRSYTIALEYETSAPQPTTSPPPESTQFYCEDGRLLVSPSTSHHGDFVVPSGTCIPFSSGGDSMVPDTDSTVRTTVVNTSHRGAPTTAGNADETSSEYTFVECSLPPTPTRSPSSRPMAGRFRASSFTIMTPSVAVSPNTLIPLPQQPEGSTASQPGPCAPQPSQETDLGSKPLLLSTRKPAMSALALPTTSPKKSTRSTTPSTTPRSVVTPRTSRAAMATRVVVSPRNRDEVQRPTPAYVGIADLESAEQELRGELIGREKAIAAIIRSHAGTDFAAVMQTVVKTCLTDEGRRRMAIEYRWACELALEVQIHWDDMCACYAQELQRAAMHGAQVLRLEGLAAANAAEMMRAMELWFSNLQMMSADALQRLLAEAQRAACAMVKHPTASGTATPQRSTQGRFPRTDDEPSPLFVVLSDSDEDRSSPQCNQVVAGTRAAVAQPECCVDALPTLVLLEHRENTQRRCVEEAFEASLRERRQHHQQTLLSNCAEAHARRSVAAHEMAARPQRYRKYAHATHRKQVAGAAIEWHALRMRLCVDALEPVLRRCIDGDAMRQRLDVLRQHEADVRNCYHAEAAVAYQAILDVFYGDREALFCAAVEQRSRSVIAQQEAAEWRTCGVSSGANLPAEVQPRPTARSTAMPAPPADHIVSGIERTEHRERHERRRLYEWYIVRLSQIKGEFSQSMVKLVLHAPTTTASSPTAYENASGDLSVPSSGASQGSSQSESPRAPHCYGDSDFATLVLS